MYYDVTDEQRKAAKLPHEIFLLNLITNHILIFVGLLGIAGSYPWVMLVTPTISIVLLSYVILRAQKALKKDDWYVAIHWQLSAFRSKLFIGMLAVLGVIIVGLLLSVGGDANQLRPGHYAVGGVAMLPTLITVLVLIIMESDAVHKAKMGQVPQSLMKKYPPPAGLKPVEASA